MLNYLMMYRNLSKEQRLQGVFALIITYLGLNYINLAYNIVEGEKINENYLLGLSISSILFSIYDLMMIFSNNHLLLSKESADISNKALISKHRQRHFAYKVTAVCSAVAATLVLILAWQGIKLEIPKELSDAGTVLGIGIPFTMIGVRRFFNLRTEYRVTLKKGYVKSHC